MWSHADFAALVVHGADPALTARICAAYAHLPQPWMDHTDGEIARRLPHLTRHAGLRLDRVDAHVLTAANLHGHAQRRVDEIVAVVQSHVRRTQTYLTTTTADVDAWHGQLRETVNWVEGGVRGRFGERQARALSIIGVLHALRPTRMPVPAIPSSLLEPVWAEFAALLPQRSEFHPDHPLGCHRRRIPDRVVFEHLVDALVHGSGYERIATGRCSHSTMRRRLNCWSAAGVAEQLHHAALAAYDRIIGLQLADIPTDGRITRAPCGGDKAGTSPVDRRKGGLKRSVAIEGASVPLGVVSAGANRHDSPLLAPALAAARTQVGPHWPEDITVREHGG